MQGDLDRDDAAILHLLQSDARNITTGEISTRVGLASSTVAARINELEARGIITGYRPRIDYEKAGLDQHILLICKLAPKTDETVVEQISEVENVISVRQLLAEPARIHVELVAPTQERLEDVSNELDELGIEITNTELIEAVYGNVFNHFGEKYTTGE
ncbi:Lrp/AsnC family transcriptional regulator [Natronomonas sp.]|uniref:Lrp/AsnC family transcriptional regulator n=1 Tax=Natronomonas sp. TaxID=2184060 RepID=UPI002FC3D983